MPPQPQMEPSAKMPAEVNKQLRALAPGVPIVAGGVGVTARWKCA